MKDTEVINKENYSYIIGLDIGIGSVGWAVINYKEEGSRIEDFGVRIFESGEGKDKDTVNQKRRIERAKRRLVRRKAHRNKRLKDLFKIINLTTEEKLKDFYKESKSMPQLKYKGLSEKLTKEEIAACIIHTSSHRGYKDFYEIEEDESKEEEGYAAMKENYKSLYKTYISDQTIKEPKSVSGMVIKNPTIFEKTGNFERVRSKNIISPEAKYLFKRDDLLDELEKLLNKQKEFYGEILTDANIKKLKEIVNSQRDFEDGPGNKEDVKRKYKGFIDTIGNCPFYLEEQRAAQKTIISALFTLVNEISKLNFVNLDENDTNSLQYYLNEILIFALLNTTLAKADITKILNKKWEFTGELDKGNNKALKILKDFKEILGDDLYKQLISQVIVNGKVSPNINNDIHKLAHALSINITPKRKREALQSLGLSVITPEIIDNCMLKSFTGTANVSYKYMLQAIHAFTTDGKMYGYFQADKIKEIFEKEGEKTKKEFLANMKTLNTQGQYDDITKNPVVFKAVNETVKVINAIIRKQGKSPYAINIEIAKEVNSSKETRGKIEKQQKNNRDKKDQIEDEISKSKEFENTYNSNSLTERYTLYKQQNGKCMYSGQEIVLAEIGSKTYEVDHIIPYSKILDNTLNNKVLVLSQENSTKGDRLPLDYLTAEKRKKFLKRVKDLKNNISKTKYQYLLLEKSSPQYDAILDNWKSRNLNDTRYITKFLVNYISKNLKFEEKDNKGKAFKNVNAVKGGLTAHLRSRWLEGSPWEIKTEEDIIRVKKRNLRKARNEVAKSLNSKIKDEQTLNRLKNEIYKLKINKLTKDAKDINFMEFENLTNILEELNIKEQILNLEEMQKKFEKIIKEDLNHLRKETHLHHALDAIVVANLTTPYIELVQDYLKMQDTIKQVKSATGKREVNWEEKDIKELKDATVKKMKTYFNMEEKQVSKILESEHQIPALLPNFKQEIEVRLGEYEEQEYKEKVKQFYKNDPQFASSLKPPIVSYKLEHKITGEITDANPIGVKEIDGAKKEVKRKKLEDFSIKCKKGKTIETTTEEDLIEMLKPIVYTGDINLVKAMAKALKESNTKENLDKGEKTDTFYMKKYINKNGFIKYKGSVVKKIKVIGDEYKSQLVSKSNTSLTPTKYYCVEVYKDTKNNFNIRGIRRADLVKVKDKKHVYLKGDLPQDYKEHVMYLKPYDFIEVTKKEKQGVFVQRYVYRSVFNVNTKTVCAMKPNKTFVPSKDTLTIGTKILDIKKYHLSILGELGGNIGCTKQFLLLKEKE